MSARRTATVAVLAIGLLGLAAPSASAFGHVTGGGGGTGAPAPGGGGGNPPPTTVSTGGSGPTRSEDVPSTPCHIVSSSSYIGASCGSFTGGKGPSIGEILGKEKLPTCWNEPMTQAEKDAIGLEDSAGRTFWWKRCLHGITKKGKDYVIAPGGVTFSMGYQSYPDDQTGLKEGDPDWLLRLTDLGPGQRKLVDSQRSDGQIPYPVIATGPTSFPRVNQDVAFFDARAEVVTVAVGGVTLRARESSLDIKPRGADGPTLKCAGDGVKVAKGDTPLTRPGACWFRYDRSSAGQPDEQYQIAVEAHWVVDYRVGNGAWREFNAFTKSAVTTLRVNEIQSLVVS